MATAAKKTGPYEGPECPRCGPPHLVAEEMTAARALRAFVGPRLFGRSGHGALRPHDDASARHHVVDASLLFREQCRNVIDDIKESQKRAADRSSPRLSGRDIRS